MTLTSAHEPGHAWHRPGYDFDPSTVASLPPTAYANEAVHDRETQRVFAPGEGLSYMGHDILLPDVGHRRSDSDPRLVLTRDQDGTVRLLANLCTHACRPLLSHDEPVCKPRLTCEYHDWTFRSDGSLIGGANFDLGRGEEAERRRRALQIPRFELLSWHGFHFAVDPDHRDTYAADLARVDDDFRARGVDHWLDLDDCVVFSTHDDPYVGDWKAFLEVFGDCYHVPPYHPGLASFVDCGSIEWTFGENFHAQFLTLSDERGCKSTKYAQWAEGLDEYYAKRGEATPRMGVGWVGIYPNLMFEVYNGLRVLSVIVPLGFGQYVNRVHYCVPADMETLVPGLAQAIVDAFEETVLEDHDLVERRHEGMVSARSLGITFDNYVPNLGGTALEAGVAHFHDWWTRRVGVPA